VQALKAGGNPGPLAEMEFWRSKATNLLSVQEQLQSDKVRKVVRVLEFTKSTYFPPFNRLIKEVGTACAEANDNAKHLRALDNFFSRMHACESFPTLAAEFRPTMHAIVLIWKHSRFYNTPARLATLVREICNELIDQARKYGARASAHSRALRSPARTRAPRPVRPGRSGVQVRGCARRLCVRRVRRGRSDRRDAARVRPVQGGLL